MKFKLEIDGAVFFISYKKGEIILDATPDFAVMSRDTAKLLAVALLFFANLTE
jgi:hypothetical protein